MTNEFLKARNKHVVAESTALLGTTYGEHIFNVKASADIDNGKLVDIDKMVFTKQVSGNTVSTNEYYTMVEPTATSRVGLILSVPIGALEKPYEATLDEAFYNAEGEIMRVYALAVGDRFVVSANGIKGTPTVGHVVVADGYDLKDQATVTASSVGFYGDIIEEITKTSGKFYKIRVRKNG